MTNANTDFFQYINCFARYSDVSSIKVFGNYDKTALYTIIIPTYKRTEFLKEAIDSALGQDCDFSFNVIVGDNNPERGCPTELFMESYIGKNNISYYKHSENIGMAGNWNRLFEIASTPWVVMLHDDDVLYPFFLSRCNELISRLNGNVGIIKPKEDRTYEPIFNKKGDLIRLYDLDFYYGNVCGTPSGMLFNREIVISLGGYNQDFYPSLDYCFHVKFAATNHFYYYTEPLMYYRISVNESVKPSVQKQWLIDASYLIRQLLNKYNLPKYIINKYVAYRTKRVHNNLHCVFHTEFDFDLKTVGLTSVNSISGKFYHWIVRLYVKIKKRHLDDMLSYDNG